MNLTNAQFDDLKNICLAMDLADDNLCMYESINCLSGLICNFYEVEDNLTPEEICDVFSFEWAKDGYLIHEHPNLINTKTWQSYIDFLINCDEKGEYTYLKI